MRVKKKKSGAVFADLTAAYDAVASSLLLVIVSVAGCDA